MEQHNTTGDKLKSYVERLERMLDEIDGLKESLKDLKGEIKSDGFNVKAVERVVALRRNSDAADREAEFINDVILYAHVTGTPLDVVAPDPSEMNGEIGNEKAS
ncbi:GapR-like DNA-binding domain-containing protein [uncultured Gammaproteobacteria bacterium]